MFWTDSIVINCSSVEAVKQWWIRSFGCKEVPEPEDWDCALPSDVALQLPGSGEPTIVLCDAREVRESGLEGSSDHPILFTGNLRKAQELLQSRGVVAGPVQSGPGPAFFVVLDPEGNSIEICEEP